MTLLLIHYARTLLLHALFGIQLPLLVIVGLLCNLSFAHSQVFIQLSSERLALDPFHGIHSWADVDTDGDQDMLISGIDTAGNATVKLYRNNGDSTFTIENTSLLPVLQGHISWGDVNLDNAPDVLITGTTPASLASTNLYINDGSGSFSLDLLASNQLTDMDSAYSAWADYDLDGDEDVILSGWVLGQPNTQLFNNNNGTTWELDQVNSTFFDKVAGGEVSWDDIDRDGDLDLAICGESVSGLGSTEIYTNENGIFTRLNANISGLLRGAIAFSDVNHDGYPDLILTGNNNGVFISELWINEPLTNAFIGSAINTNLSPVHLLVGDINGDQFSDVVFWSEQDAVIEYFLNDGTGGFPQADTLLDSLSVVGTQYIHFADIEGDQALDLMRTLLGDTTIHAMEIWYNQETPSVSPTVPVNLSANILADSSVRLSWGAIDSSQGSTYNLFIGTSPQNTNIRSSRNGILGIGNAGSTNSIIISGLNVDSTYHWSVQGINSAYIRSAFAGESSFTIADSLEAPVDPTDSFFVDVTTNRFNTIPNPLENGILRWFDLDNDGDLDVYHTGTDSLNIGTTNIYVNQNGSFTVDPILSNTFTPVINGDVAFADIDLDGDGDILLIGTNPGPGTNIFTAYINEAGTFTANAAITQGLPIPDNAQIALFDYDLDADVDLLIAGDSDAGAVLQLFKNEGLGNWVLDAANSTFFQKFDAPRIAVGDVDGDGDGDVILSGNISGTDQAGTVWYQNSGDGFFDIKSGDLTPLKNGFLVLTDYNNDGLLDLFRHGDASPIGGVEDWNTTLFTFDNNTNAFVSLAEDFGNLSDASGDLGDVNQDGFPDVILFGTSDTGLVSYWFENNQGTGFSLVSDQSQLINGFEAGVSVELGDALANGKLDMVLSGRRGENGVASFILYQNQDSTIDQLPVVPSNLQATIVDSLVTLSWTGGPGLTYDVFIGTSPDSVNVVSPQSNRLNGERWTAERGMVANSIGLSLPPDVYYWGVQSINQEFQGSAFIIQDSFEINTPIITGSSFQEATADFFPVNLPAGLDLADVVFGDYDKDDDLDVFVFGSNGTIPGTFLYENIDGQLILNTDVTFPGLQNGVISIADVNVDGNPDVLLSGNDGLQAVTNLYLGDGNGAFALAASGLPAVEESDMSWGDIDLDGDRDLFLSGQSNAGFVAAIYRNEGNGTFTLAQDIGASFQNLSSCKGDWGDSDKDGNVDLLLTTVDANGSGTSMFSLNAAGVLTLVPINIPGTAEGDIQWVDANNDGNLDILIYGRNVSNQEITSLYTNQGNNEFLLNPSEFQGIANGDLVAIDYNQDGFRDIIISGTTNEGRVSTLYENNGLGQFTEDVENREVLTDVDNGASIAVGDLDGDRKPELLITGLSADLPESRFLNIYKNIDVSDPLLIDVPQNLSAVQFGTSAILQWEIPAGLPDALQNGLSYNIKLGTSAQGVDIISPLASLNTGVRQIVKDGLITALSFKIDNLAPGTYHWSVQAIDPGGRGNAFSPVQTFDIVPTSFRDFPATIFSEGIPEGLSQGALTWGDYDNDGDLDLLAMGDVAAGFSTKLFNLSGGVYTEVATNLPDVGNGDALWNDINNDGFLDLVISGNTASGPITSIYLGNGTSDFTSILNPIPGLFNADLDVGDYDRDGDLDLVVIGFNVLGEQVSGVFQNAGDGTFVNANVPLEDVALGDVAWGDYDGNGTLDLIITGQGVNGPVTQVYNGDGTGNFAAIVTNIPALQFSEVAWGDIDNDGDLDVAILGDAAPNFVFSLYEYQNGVFEEIVIEGTGMRNGSLRWGDVNNDGFIDLLATGEEFSDTERTSRLYLNQGNNSFVLDNVNSGVFKVIDAGVGEFIDLNSDDRQDVVISGRTSSDPDLNSFNIYQNLDEGIVPAPGIPVNLRSQIVGDQLILAWDPPGNGSEGTSYNFYVGTTAGSVDIVSPSADITNGFRRITSIGNASYQTSVTLTNLVSGEYFWSVQSIGTNGVGSVFAPEAQVSFLPEGVTFVNISPAAFPSAVGLENANAAWGDYDNDGDKDLLICGETNGSPQTTLYQNENGIFNPVVAGFPNLRNGKVSWIDINNDGNLDVLLCGNSGAISVSQILTGDGAGNFTLQLVPLPGIEFCDVDWGDYDNDGDPDLLFSGQSGNTKISNVYRNDNGSFTTISANLTGISQSEVEWIDVDSDGDLDIFLQGNSNVAPVVELYINDGLGTFSLLAVNFSELAEASSAWADYNNDGGMDLLLSGLATDGSNTTLLELYENNNDGSFTQISLPFSGVREGKIAWGDINDDGQRDIIMAGASPQSPSGSISQLIVNQGGQEFALDSSNSSIFPLLSEGCEVVFGDYQNDGKLDILFIGTSVGVGNNVLFNLFENIDSTPNVTPDPPANVNLEQIGNGIAITWDPPVSAAVSYRDGFTYEIQLGTASNAIDIRDPLSIIATGNRKIMANGQIVGTSLTIEELPAATYFVRVQTIDQDFEGSAFSVEEEIEVAEPNFTDVSETLIPANLAGLNNSHLAWGDYNNDGNLDIFLSGNDQGNLTSNLLQSNGNNGFVVINTDIPGIENPSIEWGDFDKDKDLDLLISGTGAQGPFTDIFENNNGSFSALNANLPDIENGSVSWGDYNLDGSLDILLVGESQSGPVSGIYRNQEGVFTPITLTIPGFQNAQGIWIDINGDKFLDVIITGQVGNGNATIVYQNNGQGGFTEENISLLAVRNPSLSTADIDIDGDPDLLIMGESINGPSVSLYENDNGVLVDVSSSINALTNSSASWGDINMDGYPDVLITGTDNTSGTEKNNLYINDGTGGFDIDNLNGPFFNQNLEGSSAAVGDYDFDGRLDIVFSGSRDSDGANKLLLYRNIFNSSLPPLQAPDGLQFNQTGGEVTLSWNFPQPYPANLVNGLSYDIELTYLTDNKNIFVPSSDSISGDRRLVSGGQIRSNNELIIPGLEPGTYRLRVQAVDQIFAGSIFSDPFDFTFLPEGATYVDYTDTAFSDIITGVEAADISWADIDNDNDFDILISGQTSAGELITELYRNGGPNGFSFDQVISNQLPGVQNGSISWADYDSDGFIDLLIAGQSNTERITHIYRNNGGGSFDLANSSLNGLNASVSSGDYDRDGLFDLLLTGTSDNGPFSSILHNEGNFSFSALNANLANVQQSSANWVDFNNDGFLDVFLSGDNGGDLVSSLYKGDGTGTFTLVNAGFQGVKNGSSDWGDVDNDGFPDLILTGETSLTGFNPISVVYRNNGDETFTSIVSLIGVVNGNGEWLDYDQDGFMDIVLTGTNGQGANSYVSLLYQNQGGLSFRLNDVDSDIFDNVGQGSIASWADIDQDGRQDLVIAGRTSDNPVLNTFVLYRNVSSQVSEAPGIPVNLQANQSGKSMIFSWDLPASAPIGLANGYTANIAVGTTSGSYDIVSPLSDPATGFYRITEDGNAGHAKSFVLRDLTEGTYFWTVQLIDQDGQASNFATESSFAFVNPDFEDQTLTYTPGINIDEGFFDASISWADINGDGFTDMFVQGKRNPTLSETLIYKNVADSLIVDTRLSNSIANVSNGEFDFSDYDRDGDVDVLLTGVDGTGSAVSILYQNEGDSLIEQVATSNLLPKVIDGSAAWGDYDNDGDEDLAICGNQNGTFIGTIYINNGNGTFTEDIEAGAILLNVTSGELAWGDLDGDSDLDLIISGTAAAGPQTAIFLNDGTGGLSPSPNIGQLANVFNASIDLGDIDNDGDVDIALSGSAGATNFVTEIYVNDGSGSFLGLNAGLTATTEGSVQFGDFNDDGLRDLLISGLSSNGPITELYTNNGGSFLLDSINSSVFSNIESGIASWIDIQKDGKLDIVLTGKIDNTFATRFNVYQNNELTPNVIPGPPENLTVVQQDNAIELSWGPPANIPANTADGLTYNIYLQSFDGTRTIIFPEADLLTGNLRFPGTSNMGNNNSFTITGLPSGTYIWGAQVIDQGFSSSVFTSPADTFDFIPQGANFFDETTNKFSALPSGLIDGSVAWADYNADGLLDFVVTGESENGLVIQIYMYDANLDRFVLSPSGTNSLENGKIKHGSLAWGDYNNDNFPDLLIVGEGENGAGTFLFVNQQDGTFTEEITILPPVQNGEAIWGDVDNDGYRDVLVTGQGVNGPISKMFKNNQGQGFVDLSVDIVPLQNSRASFADYNNDGKLDLLLTGLQIVDQFQNPVSIVYQNTGDGEFSINLTPITGVKSGDAEWLDVNNDGFLDFIIAGDTTVNISPTTKIYINQGNDSFTESVIALVGMRNGELATADVNNDGWVDVVISGQNGANSTDRITYLYKNNQTGGLTFDVVNSANTVLKDASSSSLAVGDYNNDNRIDLILTGTADVGNGFFLYENIDVTNPLLPGIPQGLTATQNGDEIILSWEAPPASANELTYNLYIRPEQDAGANAILSPLADVNSGFRSVVAYGISGKSLSWNLQGIPSGSYIWGVQAINNAFQSSSFAPQDTFTFIAPDFEDLTINLFDNVPDSVGFSTLDWIDFNSDGLLDLFITGFNGTGPVAQLYRNVSQTDTKFEATSNFFAGVQNGSVAWTDVNLDGNLDVIITGNQASRTSPEPLTELYFGNDLEGFDLQSNDLPDVEDGSVDWGDIDNDGDPDLIITGKTSGSTFVSEIYINNEASFERFVSGFPGVHKSAVAWGDYDADGDLDLIITGNTDNNINSRFTAIYRQSSQGTFIQQPQYNLPEITQGSVDWSDFDQDGDLDLLLTGNTNLGRISNVYRYDNELDSFSAIVLQEQVENGDAKWGDFDDDGWVDIILTGQNGPTELDRTTRLFKNDSTGNFIDQTINSDFFQDLNNGSSIAWGDFNDDGKLDLVASGGIDVDDTYLISLYQNRLALPNRDVEVPTNLQAIQEGNSIIFSWEPPLGVVNPFEYSYNLIVGTQVQGDDVISPLADPASGNRKIVQIGNAGFNTSFKLTNLDSARTYFWSVQAIGADFEGSDFPNSPSINFVPPNFEEVTGDLFPQGAPVNTYSGTSAWGDYDDNGALDLFISGLTDGTPQARLYRNERLSGFTALADTFPGLGRASAAWGDINNDGTPELVYCGENIIGQPRTYLYFNNGGSLVDTSARANLPDIVDGDLEWIDYDNDGDLDLFMMGEQGGSPITRIIRNNGRINFTPIQLGIRGLRSGDSDWIDYDRDGDVDLLISGVDISGNLFAGVFVNTFGRFEPLASANLQPLGRSKVKWVDLDLDTNIDIIITGQDQNDSIRTDIYLNDGTTFTLNQTNPALKGVVDGTLEVVDYNGDGFVDLLLSGQSGPNIDDSFSGLFLNDGNGNFTSDAVNSAILPLLQNPSMSWADYDSDGKIDLFISGQELDNGIFIPTFGLFRNMNPPVAPLVSNPPTGLSIAPDNNILDQINFDWIAPNDINPNLVPSLTYNIYISDSLGQTFLTSPLADIDNGFRKVVRIGNVGPASEWNIRGLGSGKYFWSVQVIGPDMSSSEFAEVDSFEYTAPVFTDVTSTSFIDEIPPGLVDGSMDWGDYNNDGLLDLAVTGTVSDADTGFTRIFQNTPSGFRALPLDNLLPLQESSIRWIDYDNDGFLDIFHMGFDGNINKVAIYRNLDSARFEALVDLRVLALKNGDVDWGDYDNDGDMDFVIIGDSPKIDGTSDGRTILYENGGNGNFTRVADAGFSTVFGGSIRFADYDNDGDLDILYNGTTGSLPSTKLYQFNQTTSRYTEIDINGQLPILESGSIDWGDYDNDGDLDILMTGRDGSEIISGVYRNDGDNTFVDIAAGLVTTFDGDARWGDYNDDGYIDILMTGNNGSEKITQIYRNEIDASNIFVPDDSASFSLPGVDKNAAIIWGDYNNDGKLDIALTGRTVDDPEETTFRLFRNGETTENRVPLIPTNLSQDQDIEEDDVILRWSPSAGYLIGNDTTIFNEDTLQFNAGFDPYTYNIWLGRDSLDASVINPMSLLESGFRKVVRKGNVNKINEWIVKGLATGDYFWTVQAIDTDFEGSGFAPLQRFRVDKPPFREVTTIVFDPSEIPSQFSNSSMSWGDYDNDNDLDLLISGKVAEGNHRATLYEFDGAQFREVPFVSDSLFGLASGGAEWGDYDNDGDLDILLSGEDASGTAHTCVYRNDPDRRFSEDVLASNNITDITLGEAKWGDYDNDGDLDVILAGRSNSGTPIAEVIENILSSDGTRTFRRDDRASADLVGVEQGSLDLGDFDKDGFLDILLTGFSANNATFAEVYRNNGVGRFIDFNAPINSVVQSDAAWGDFNNDGFLDILITGNRDPIGDFPESQVFVYGVNRANFSIAKQFSPGIKKSHVQWGDFDNDGLLDIFMIGEETRITESNEDSLSIRSSIFSNDGRNDFIENLAASNVTSNPSFGNGAWGDYDGDGKLDLVISGDESDSSGLGIRLYKNVEAPEPLVLDPPSNLVGTAEGDKILLSWSPPESYDSALVKGLTYNVIVGIDTINPDIVSPLSSTNTGFRRVVRLGNTFHNSSYSLGNIPDTTYCWAVQAVAPNYQGSSFQVSDTCITFTNPRPVVENVEFPHYVRFDNDTSVSVTVRNLDAINRVLFVHKGISEGPSEWDSVVVNFPTGNIYTDTIITGNRFGTMIPNVNEIGLTYYFKIVGKFGLDAISDTGYTYIYHDNGLSTSISGGSVSSAYDILAFPLLLPDTSQRQAKVSTVFIENSGFGEYDIKQWRFWRYNTLGQNLVEFDESVDTMVMRPGKGYWLISRSLRTINTGRGITVPANEFNPFSIRLLPGWNQIGNPYNFNISWNDIQSYNRTFIQDEVDSLQFAGFNQGVGYAQASADPIIENFNGAFVFSHAETDLRFPVIKNTNIQRRIAQSTETQLNHPIDHAYWEVVLMAISPQKPEAIGVIGMNKAAKVSRDGYDLMAYPRISDYLDINFDHPEYFYRRFQKDVVPTRDHYVWECYIGSSADVSVSSLKWDNSFWGNNGKQLVLFDIEQQVAINMRNQQEYSFPVNGRRKYFKIYYGNEAFIDSSVKIVHDILLAPFPNPAEDAVTIPINLPILATNEMYELSIDIYNNIGQKIITLFEGAFPEGYHEIKWDARGLNANKVAGGIYTIRINATDGKRQFEGVERLWIK